MQQPGASVWRRHLLLGDLVLVYPDGLNYQWPAQVAEPQLLGARERPVVLEGYGAGRTLVLFPGLEPTWSHVATQDIEPIDSASVLAGLYYPTTGPNSKVRSGGTGMLVRAVGGGRGAVGGRRFWGGRAQMASKGCVLLVVVTVVLVVVAAVKGFRPR